MKLMYFTWRTNRQNINTKPTALRSLHRIVIERFSPVLQILGSSFFFSVFLKMKYAVSAAVGHLLQQRLNDCWKSQKGLATQAQRSSKLCLSWRISFPAYSLFLSFLEGHSLSGYQGLSLTVPQVGAWMNHSQRFLLSLSLYKNNN